LNFIQKTKHFVTYVTIYTFPTYRDAGKSLVRPKRKQATATEDFDVHISFL